MTRLLTTSALHSSSLTSWSSLYLLSCAGGGD